MLQELWAKLSAREKLMAYGAAAVAVAVVVGMILGTQSYGVAGFSVSINYFTAENAGLFALLALIGAIATLVVLYLHVAPNANITWPAPYAQILLAVAAFTAACAVLIVLMQLIRAGGFGPEPPIFMYLADIVAVGGGALLGYAAYMEWTANKAA